LFIRTEQPWVYNARRQPVLKGQAPNDIVQNRLTDKPELASKLDQPPAEFCARPKAMVVVERAKEVSHPDTQLVRRHCPQQARRERDGAA
jgi:hypothetical protein